MKRFGLIDRYILRLTTWPLVGALAVTLIALLLERVLRLLDALSQSSDRFGFVLELTANLVPHYLGLTLPAAFFVALFIVVTRLSDGSEIDAMLAGGRSLSQIAAPFVALGLVLTVVSLILFGFVQPYSRYAYRAVLHSAQSAGWSGTVAERTIISGDGGLMITADSADVSGRSLQGVFIRRLEPDGSEQIITAGSAEINLDRARNSAALILKNGQQLRIGRSGESRALEFSGFIVEVPLAGASRLLRARGGDERELTLIELVTGTDQAIPLAARMAELYGRLARALALPFLPLLALPLGLAAKRGGRAPGVILAGVILIAFQNILQLGQSLAVSGQAPPLAAIGLPFAAFAALCLWIFMGSRQRPGDTPIARFTQGLLSGVRWIKALFPARRRVRA